MKGLILMAFVFLSLTVFLIVNVKKQTKQIQGQINAQKAQSNGPNLNASVTPQNFKASFAESPLTDVNQGKFKNFFQQAVINEGRMFRWPKSHLTYYIDLSTQRRITKSKVRRAFDQWERKSHIFSFSETYDPSKADIAITVATASEKNRMGEAGPDISYAGQSFKIGGKQITEYVIKHAKVTIAADYFDFKKVEEYQKAGVDHGFQTLVHELGHVLGIMGHSPNIGECMYFQADPSGKACNDLTPEVNTLAILYGKSSALSRGFYSQK
jgi:predicted Zn-dependent protease